MNPRLVDEKTRHVAKVRLSRHIGGIAPAIAKPQTKGQRVQPRSYPALLQQPFRLAVPWLETEVFVNHETDIGVRRCVRNHLGLVDRRRQRLLADDVNPTLGRFLADFPVSLRAGDHVHKVGTLHIQHLAKIGVAVGNAKTPARRRGPVRIEVATSRNLDLGDPHPRIIVELAEVAGPHPHTPQLCHGRILFPSRGDDPHLALRDPARRSSPESPSAGE